MENNKTSQQKTQPTPRKQKRNKAGESAKGTKDFKAYCTCCMEWCKKHFVKLKGLGAIILGLVLVFSRRRYLIEFGIGIAGIMLIYYGLTVLRLTQVTTLFDRLVGRIRR